MARVHFERRQSPNLIERVEIELVNFVVGYVQKLEIRQILQYFSFIFRFLFQIFRALYLESLVVHCFDFVATQVDVLQLIDVHERSPRDVVDFVIAEVDAHEGRQVHESVGRQTFDSVVSQIYFFQHRMYVSL